VLRLRLQVDCLALLQQVRDDTLIDVKMVQMRFADFNFNLHLDFDGATI
jgi:hypothetical protein